MTIVMGMSDDASLGTFGSDLDPFGCGFAPQPVTAGLSRGCQEFGTGSLSVVVVVGLVIRERFGGVAGRSWRGRAFSA
jgi:hypothetical protein